jgi:hypothetical protein
MQQGCRQLIFIILVLGAATAINSCRPHSEQVPDVSNIKITLQTYRFDKDLYAIDTNHIADGLKQLKTKYPDFLDYYLDTLHEYGIHGNYNDTVKGIREDVRQDLTYKDFVNLEDTIKKCYPDNKDLDEELTGGFRFLKYYFPSAIPPRVIYLNMGLSKWPSFPVDNATICVGLDMFLGPQFPYYNSIGVPPYMASHLRKSYIPVSVFHTVYQASYPWQPDDKTLLDLIIVRGKEQYYLHKILPYKPDSVLFGFTQKQLQWCRENEGLIYNFFIQQNLLYNKEPLLIMPYVNDGPYAKGLEAPDDLVKKTPGNIGSWLGYRIICAYLEQYPKTTLAELLAGKSDAVRFLDSAKYRPK